MDKQLERIKEHIDNSFADIMENISLTELYNFKTHIMGEEILLPFLKTDIALELEFLRQRVESLTNLLEGEEWRREKEYIQKEETEQ